MIDIRYIKFDGTHIPIIPQVCNNIGKYGAGYSGAISSRWPIVENNYLEWANKKEELFNTSGEFILGENQYVNCGDALIVNMIAQSGVRSKYRPVVIQYPSFMACMFKISQLKFNLPVKYYIARIGSGLAGGKWEDIKYYIELFLREPNQIVYL